MINDLGKRIGTVCSPCLVTEGHTVKLESSSSQGEG